MVKQTAEQSDDSFRQILDVQGVIGNGEKASQTRFVIWGDYLNPSSLQMRTTDFQHFKGGKVVFVYTGPDIETITQALQTHLGQDLIVILPGMAYESVEAVVPLLDQNGIPAIIYTGDSSSVEGLTKPKLCRVVNKADGTRTFHEALSAMFEQLESNRDAELQESN